MADVINFPAPPSVSSHYREIKSYTENAGEDDLRIVLASEDERPGHVHVMLIGEGLMEVLDTFRDNEAGRGLAGLVGVAADKAIFFAMLEGEDAA